MRASMGRVAIAAALVAVTAGAASADENNPFARRGAFVGLGATWQVSGFQEELRDAAFGNSWGFNARGGYRFADWFALEGIFEYADKFGANAPRSEGSSVSLISTTGNAKFIVPLDRFQPYLSLGAGFLYAEKDGKGFIRNLDDVDFGFAGRIGGGLDFYLTPAISLFVDNGWTMATPDTENLYFYSLGFGGRYNF
jgi:opacity protein-like surface antigen